VPLWVSVGGFAAHEYRETCAQRDSIVAFGAVRPGDRTNAAR